MTAKHSCGRNQWRFGDVRAVAAASVVALACVACLSTSGGGNTEGAGGAPASGPGSASSECDSCTASKCGSQSQACESAVGCGDVIDCVLGCDNTDADCQLGCADQGSALSNEALMAGNQLQSCLALSCVQECWGAGTAGPGGSPGPSPGAPEVEVSVGSAECQSCSASSCAAEWSACESATGCAEVIDCAAACDASDSGCATACSNQASGLSAEAQQAGGNYSSCLLLSCGAPCFGTDLGPGSPSPVTPSPGAPSQLDPTPGGTVPATPSSPTPVDPGPQTPTSGELVSGTNWLSFEGDWADASAFPNGDLNISGALYAYGDDCARFDWDPTTRCVSGELCDPGPDYANWGVAVGFDFHNTGELGSPANAKKTWDASAVGALGVAWALSGTAPALQVWVTNMDPSHAGTCTVDSCEIAGPPDGNAAASTTDDLRFASMAKDDWGGSGTVYTFDPSAILSLQFKLPAINAGAASFAFCVDDIGIIR